MKLVTLDCPKCGASLNIETDDDTFFCKYCGARLHTDWLDKDKLNAQLRLIELDYEERARDKDRDLKQRELDKNASIELEKLKAEQKDSRHTMIMLIGLLISVLAWMAITYLMPGD